LFKNIYLKMIKNSIYKNHNNLMFGEDFAYNYNLNFFTKFNLIADIVNQKKCTKVSLN